MVLVVHALPPSAAGPRAAAAAHSHGIKHRVPQPHPSSVQLGLSVKDMFNFCMAPASASDLRLSAALLQFATKYRWGSGWGGNSELAVVGGFVGRASGRDARFSLFVSLRPQTQLARTVVLPLPIPARSKGQPVTLDISVPDRVPASTEELRHMEAAHQVGQRGRWGGCHSCPRDSKW